MHLTWEHNPDACLQHRIHNIFWGLSQGPRWGEPCWRASSSAESPLWSTGPVTHPLWLWLFWGEGGKEQNTRLACWEVRLDPRTLHWGRGRGMWEGFSYFMWLPRGLGEEWAIASFSLLADGGFKRHWTSALFLTISSAAQGLLFYFFFSSFNPYLVLVIIELNFGFRSRFKSNFFFFFWGRLGKC